MKNLTPFFLVVMLFAFATQSVEGRSAKGYYTFSLDSVVNNSTSYRGINAAMENQPDGCTSAICKVGQINFRWAMHPTHFDLIVVNGGRGAVKILWEQSSLTMPTGRELKVTNNVKQYDATQQFVPTIIERGSIFSGVVVPTDRIKSSYVIETNTNPDAVTTPHGTQNPVDQSYTNKKKYNISALLGEFNKGLSDGKSIKTTLALEVDGEVCTYEFYLSLSYTKQSVELVPTSVFLVECAPQE